MALPRRPRVPMGQTPAPPGAGLIEQLFDEIERNPQATVARVILMQQWINAGVMDAAENTAQELLSIDPSNAEAQRFLESRGINIARSIPGSSSIGGRQGWRSSETEKRATPQPAALPRTAAERTAMEQELSEGYTALLAQANVLLQESRLLQELQQRERITTKPNGLLQNLKTIVDGRVSAVVTSPPPLSARAVARMMEADPAHALEIVVVDFADMVRWLRNASNAATRNNDALRESLVKRGHALTAALPGHLQPIPAVALMHAEHEELDRTYVNTQTMLLEPVAAIPRANFWVTEDGWAWDMEQLAQSVASNGGVMRNPLSHQMFSVDDVRAIVQHPLGRRLQAMHLEQSRLRQGVRPTTIDRLAELSTTLLSDASDHQVPSRQAIDNFLLYMATLPHAEQHALDTLRVPATDSHTGQSFDCTIGEAVRDGKANKICLHKTGDLIGQAVGYLRRSNA